MGKNLNGELQNLDTSLNKSQESKNKHNGLWYKAKMLGAVTVIAISWLFTSCNSDDNSIHDNVYDAFNKVETAYEDADEKYQEERKEAKSAKEDYDAKKDLYEQAKKAEEDKDLNELNRINKKLNNLDD